MKPDSEKFLTARIQEGTMARKRRNIDNHEWIRTHFNMLVRKYGGQYVFVAAGRVFPVKDIQNIRAQEDKISKRFGKPVGMPIPSRREFNHLLTGGRIN